MSEAAEVTNYSVGVIFLDVDDFKQLNSSFTESVVDRTLLLISSGLLQASAYTAGPLTATAARNYSFFFQTARLMRLPRWRRRSEVR